MGKAEEKKSKVFHVFETISAGYDQANGRISLGLERRWKKALTDAIVSSVPAHGTVLDVCCGTGDIALAIAAERPDLSVTGLDFSPAMLAVAAKKSDAKHISVSWQRGDALHLPFSDNTFSAATISFGLRNTTDYGLAIREMRRVTKPGGQFCCLDSYVPETAGIQPFYKLYFQVLMPVIGGGLAHRAAYKWLSESTAQFITKEEVTNLLLDAGWRHVRCKSFLFGSCVLHTACADEG